MLRKFQEDFVCIYVWIEVEMLSSDPATHYCLVAWEKPSPTLIKVKVTVTPSQSYGASLAIWDHTVLPASLHKWTHPAITPARKTSTQFTYPGGMEGW